MEKCSKCNLPSVNKKYQLCTLHNWERMNPGKNYYAEQNKKQKEYNDKQVAKALLKPKKVYVFKAKINPPKPKPATTQKKQTPIKQFSKKRSKVEAQYSKERKHFLALNPICQVCKDEGLSFESTEVHHKRGRGTFYWDAIAEEIDMPLTADTRWFLAVCRTHHDFIENHAEWAKEKGYSLSRLEQNGNL